VTFDEYIKWQKNNQPKTYAESTKTRWRAQAKKAIVQALELSKAEQRDVKEAIVTASPWSNKNPTQTLIWLQKSHAMMRELKLWDLPKH
jgi:hypothetical protein